MVFSAVMHGTETVGVTTLGGIFLWDKSSMLNLDMSGVKGISLPSGGADNSGIESKIGTSMEKY